MRCECTDETQRRNIDFLSCNTTRIFLLRPFLDSAAPFNPSSFCSRRKRNACPSHFITLYPCKTTFSPFPAEHSPPPSILPDTFVQSGMASEPPHVGGETIGVNQPTSFIRQLTVTRVHFGEACTYPGGEQTCRGDLVPGLIGPGQRYSWKMGNSNYSCWRSLTGGLAQV